MKDRLINTLKTGIYCGFLMLLTFCSTELVLIEEEDRTELDSLDNQIILVTDELIAAQIERNALQRRVDSLNNVLNNAGAASNSNPDVIYTLQVINGSEAFANGRTTAIVDALITIGQGGSTIEQTTDGTGMVTFPELESGIISVTVEIANYSDVYLIVDLRDAAADPDGSNADNRYASTQVTVFSTQPADMFTISGTGYYDQNLDNRRGGTQNDPLHPLTDSLIFETVPGGTDFQITCSPATIPQNHARPGQILQAVYVGLVRVASMDNNGDYSISLPVVLRTSGANLFTYTGPQNNTNLEGLEESSAGDIQRIWVPSFMYPNSLGELQIFPGGNSIQDVYYLPF